MGVVILDARGRVMAANRAARALIESGTALTITKAMLHARSPESDDSLSAAIDVATRGGADDGIGYFRLRQQGSGDLLHGYAIGLSPDGDGAVAGVAVFVYDPELRSSSERHLRNMFRLSAAEARVAALIVEGYAVSEAATMLKISVHTVRTQLKNIFAKTGVSRQNELVRVATKGLGLIAHPNLRD